MRENLTEITCASPFRELDADGRIEPPSSPVDTSTVDWPNSIRALKATILAGSKDDVKPDGIKQGSTIQDVIKHENDSQSTVSHSHISNEVTNIASFRISSPETGDMASHLSKEAEGWGEGEAGREDGGRHEGGRERGNQGCEDCWECCEGLQDRFERIKG